jgi:hypothetical protein
MSHPQNDAIIDDFREWLELHAYPVEDVKFYDFPEKKGKKFVFHMRKQEFSEVPEEFIDFI